jgi:hypothetical protein
MRKKPAIMWLTLLLAVAFLVRAVRSLIRVLQQFGIVETGSVSVLGYADFLFNLVVKLGLSLAMIYAIGRRPRWGYSLAICFSVLFALTVLSDLMVAQPRPAQAIQDVAEAWGEKMGAFLLAAGSIAYVLCMLFGRNARAYFLPAPDIADPSLD